MKDRIIPILLLVVVLLASGWYMVEPWVLTFIDDGPYYAEVYPDAIDELPLRASVELRRFGVHAYTLEARSLGAEVESVLVLRDADGEVIWKRRPYKPDGELGTVKLLRAAMRWDFGWRVRIAPSNQESGDLYLGPRGGFRFYNHSW